MTTVTELPRGIPIILLEIQDEAAERIARTLQVCFYRSDKTGQLYAFVEI
jgi:hypothetical protein